MMEVANLNFSKIDKLKNEVTSDLNSRYCCFQLFYSFIRQGLPYQITWLWNYMYKSSIECYEGS